jgi:hypothetical protein
MNRPSRSLLCVLASTLLAVPACSSKSSSTGSGGPSGGGTFSSGKPATQQVSEVSDADFAAICQQAKQFFSSDPSLKDIGCKASGIFAAALAAAFGATSDADVQKACSDVYNACVMSAGADAGTSSGSCTKPTGTCTATVGDYEACVNDTAAAARTAAASLPSCATLTIAQLQSDAGSGMNTSSEQPASCKTLEQKCPGSGLDSSSSQTPPQGL